EQDAEDGIGEDPGQHRRLVGEELAKGSQGELVVDAHGCWFPPEQRTVHAENRAGDAAAWRKFPVVGSMQKARALGFPAHGPRRKGHNDVPRRGYGEATIAYRSPNRYYP